MKEKRQKKIIEIITSMNVETQDELAGFLKDAGFETTQATVSRDIRELKLRKVQSEIGHQKYALSVDMGNALKVKNTASLREILTGSIISMETAGNLIVIKTMSGIAMAAAAAIDDLDIEGIAGCIAGDDTVFVAVKHIEAIENVKKRISSK